MRTRTHSDAQLGRLPSDMGEVVTGRPLCNRGVRPTTSSHLDFSVSAKRPSSNPSRCKQKAFEFADEPFAARRPVKLPATPMLDALKAARQREIARLVAASAQPNDAPPCPASPAPPQT